MTKSKNFLNNLIKTLGFGSGKGEEQNPVSDFFNFCDLQLPHIIFMTLLCFDWSEGQNEEDLERIAQQEQKVFPFETLVAATKDFHPSNKLGEGGFGPVFKVRSDCNLVWLVSLVAEKTWANELVKFSQLTFFCWNWASGKWKHRKWVIFLCLVYIVV